MATETYAFGTLSTGEAVTAARLTNARGMAVTVLDYGATIQSLVVPDRNGRPVDVVLGYDTVAEYEAHDGYLGATVGRVANRISGAAFTLDGTTYRLAANDGENHLHGGLRGFDKYIWDMRTDGGGIICSRLSPDGEEGYPGNLAVTVTFTLTEDGALRIAYDADTDADTPVNLTNHSYFNLDGSPDILAHRLQVFADRFCENDAGCLPTGRLPDVAGTPFDFRVEKAIGENIGADDEQLRLAGGYDHNFCLTGRRAAILRSDASGIRLTVDTDRPGMQVYSSNFLTRRPGKGGCIMDRRGALCLETQLYPNALAISGFPSPILRAGQHLHSETVFSFSNGVGRPAPGTPRRTGLMTSLLAVLVLVATLIGSFVPARPACADGAEVLFVTDPPIPADVVIPPLNGMTTLWGGMTGIPIGGQILAMGDSYLLGYAPEGKQTSWGTVIAELTASEVTSLFQADSGFVRPGNRGGTLIDVVKIAYDSMRNPDVVIIGGGINDCLVNSSPAQMEAAGYTLGCLLHQFWPNAAAYVFAPLWSNSSRVVYDDADVERIAALAKGIERANAENPDGRAIRVITDCWTWMYELDSAGLISSDGVHPLSAGHAIIAEHMLAAMSE